MTKGERKREGETENVRVSSVLCICLPDQVHITNRGRKSGRQPKEREIFKPDSRSSELPSQTYPNGFGAAVLNLKLSLLTHSRHLGIPHPSTSFSLSHVGGVLRHLSQ